MLDQRLEGAGDVVADLDHEPDVRVARFQLLFQSLHFSAHRGFLPHANRQ